MGWKLEIPPKKGDTFFTWKKTHENPIEISKTSFKKIF